MSNLLVLLLPSLKGEDSRRGGIHETSSFPDDVSWSFQLLYAHIHTGFLR